MTATRRHCRLAFLLIAAAAAARCINGSPESHLTAPTGPTLSTLVVTGLGETANPGQTVQLTATATYSDTTTSDVTQLVQWRSGNEGIATVSSGGLVTFVAIGETDIRATLTAITAAAMVRVTAAPIPRHTLSGRVTDADNGRPLAEARVEILDGADAGKFAVTAADGDYAIQDLTQGTFNVRVSRRDFDSAQRPVTLTESTRLDVALRPLIDVTDTYGTYRITLRVLRQQCSEPVALGTSGQVVLSGRRDGTGFRLIIRERDTQRQYDGRMREDGSFSARGDGLFAGIGPGPVRTHDYTGEIFGRVTGNRIEGTEAAKYGAPCPGGFIDISFSGSK